VRVRRPLTLLPAALALLAAALALAGCTASPPDEGAAAAAEPPRTEVAVEPTAETSAPAEPATASPARELVYVEGARDVSFTPPLSAEAYIAIDADTGRVLVARRERERRPVASLTKIMTALIVIERGDLRKKLRVAREATFVEPSLEGLKAGRWYERRLLLYSALMVSANDSAAALAYDAGDGSINRFFRMMNSRARELGMTDTTYRSASGLEDELNLSSARDQAIVSRAALENSIFARIVRTRHKVVDWPPPTYSKEWVNHNKMLFSYAGTFGVKTGYTAAAGACLAVAVRRGGHSVIAVVLGSNAIWADMPRLVDAAFKRIGA
jgi:D-alanyl-D-alanine carboxypeptidase